MRRLALLLAAGVIAAAGVAHAQILPGVPPLGAPVGGVLPRAVEPLADGVRAVPTRIARTLERARLDRLTALVRDHPREIALDPDGFPARAGEVVIEDPDDRIIAAATARGFTIVERADALGVGFARLGVPSGMSLRTAIRDLRKLGASGVTADQLHFQSGAITAAVAPPVAGDRGPAIVIIDGGVAGGAAEQRGYAAGAPRPSNHGTAVASLILGRGAVRGVAPDARLYAADVYGSDPAGGNATAIAKALAWMAVARVPVVTISLVGPSNPLLARVVAAAQARGTIVVAAVGNDGPAAPPAFPASYPGVIAVTGVDARGRVLIEAGRAAHLDYAAPGADMLAANAGGGTTAVRGTSFAAPLVAATILNAYPAPDPQARRAALAKVDAGARKGPRYGRGLVCERCRTPEK